MVSGSRGPVARMVPKKDIGWSAERSHPEYPDQISQGLLQDDETTKREEPISPPARDRPVEETRIQDHRLKVVLVGEELSAAAETEGDNVFEYQPIWLTRPH